MISFNTLPPKNNQSGFTIVELMISTAVFAVILLVAVLMITKSLDAYYKVSVDTSVSSTLQAVNSTVEQDMQSQDSTVLPQGSDYLCTSDEEFIYNLGKEMPTEVSSLPQPYALYEFPIANLAQCDTTPELAPFPSAIASGQSLLGTHYRLLAFNVTPVNLLDEPAEWNVDIKIAYSSGGVNGAGDDLLCSPSIGVSPPTQRGGCSPSSPSFNYLTDLGNITTDAGIICKSDSGEQYCNIEELQGIVGSHVN
jgi:prepilin-type N-terminal cleavage/methylation domain-containing protein